MLLMLVYQRVVVDLHIFHDMSRPGKVLQKGGHGNLVLAVGLWNAVTITTIHPLCAVKLGCPPPENGYGMA
jgi:hypothetical protein